MTGRESATLNFDQQRVGEHLDGCTLHMIILMSVTGSLFWMNSVGCAFFILRLAEFLAEVAVVLLPTCVMDCFVLALIVACDCLLFFAS